MRGPAFFAVSCLLLAAPAHGQEGAPRFDHLSVEDGLSHSTVTSIVQDHHGFLWIASQEGLNRYDGYGFKVYRHDPEDAGSLADNEAFTLLVDNRGELWIGTYGAGLDRFVQAEERFDHFSHRPDDPASLSHPAVLSLLETDGGTLWVGTEDGLNRLHRDNGTFTRYLHDLADGQARKRITVSALLEHGSGELWAGTSEGLYRFADMPPPPTGPRVETRGYPTSSLRDGTAELTLYEAVRPDAANADWGGVNALLEDSEGDLWIGTGDGLKRLDPETGAVVHYRHDAADPRSLSEDYVQSLYRDRAGALWVGTLSQGLDRFDWAKESFSHFRHDPLDPESLNDNSVLSIFEDSRHILWLGSYVGINKYDRRRARFGTLRQRPGQEATFSAASLWALHQDSAGRLWVGTYASGLDRLEREQADRQWRIAANYAPDPTNVTPAPLRGRAATGGPGALPHGTVSALHEDRSGTLWVGTWGGLSRFDPALERFVTYRHDPEDPSSLGENTVYSIHEDRGRRLWVGTWGGLNRLERDPSGREEPYFVRYPSAPGEPAILGETPIFAILEDRRGVLWFGSDRDGLLRLAAGRFEHFRHDPARRQSLSGDKIAALHEDSAGRLWVGTYGAGLTGLDAARQRFRHYRRKDGLPSDSVLGILEDDRGRLWLATTHGLSRFDPRAESFRNYDAGDGLQSDVFSSRSAFRGGSGEMFFGGIRGLNAFFPADVEDDLRPPPVAITDLLLFNRPVALRSTEPDSPLARSILATEKLVLSHRDYVVGFEFAALHFANPKKNRYAYRLEGFDRYWVAAGAGQRLAQYSNLRPGDYTFRVKASNGDGVWNEDGAALEITVLPPPWRTWWAWSLYLGALATAAAVYLRSHRRHLEHERRINQRLRRADGVKSELIAELEAKNVELERFTYTVSHDLKSPLVTIKGFLGLARKDAASGDPARMEHDLERIESAAEKMAVLLDDLLRLSRVGRAVNTMASVTMNKLAKDAVSLLAGEIAERGVEVEIMPGLPPVLGDSTQMIQVMQNLIHNAIKYMGPQPSPKITVGMRPGKEDGEEAVFFVRDNGAGIEPADREKVFGLFERLDAPGEGTGVGLALVKRIVEVHGGRIWVESEGRFKGSTFCFTLATGPSVRTG